MPKEAREMVQVVLYEDGTYEVNDIEPCHATQQLVGYKNGKNCKMYNCLKRNWKKYLIKLLDTKDIEKQILELQRRKKSLDFLRSQIAQELRIKNREKIVI